MTITLTGSNSFSLRRRLQKLGEAFSAKYGELAVEKIDAEEASEGQIIDAVSSLPFLAERKMVVLRNLSANKSAAEQIEQIIDSAGDTTDIIFYEPQTDKRTSFHKALKQKTKFEEFNDLTGQQLAKWLVDEAAAQGSSLKTADASYLIERLGNNQQLLANELAKLAVYDSEISKQSIDLLTEPTPQSRIFDLLDASFGGDKQKALALYEEQRAQKVEPQAILSMIAWQLQLIILTKYAGGRSSSQIAKDSGLSPYPIGKAAKLAAKLSQEKIKSMIDEAFKIDWRSKTTNLDLDEALKTYIVAL